MNKSLVIATGFDPEGPFAGLLLPPAFLARQRETRFKQEWRLPRAIYHLAMGHPHYQRGSIGHASSVVSAAAPPAGTVFLTGHTVSDFSIGPGASDARIVFYNNGQLEADRLGIGNVFFSGQWWTDEIEASIGDSYEARHLSSGKTGIYDVEAAVADAWITLTSNRSWGVIQSSNGTDTCTATFEVGLDGVESALDSAAITTTALFDDS